MIVDIGKSDVVVTNLYQYDYGQSMDFSGGQIIDGTEVHFFQGEYGCRTEVKGNSAPIPDYQLMNSKKILAYLYVADELIGKTIKRLTLLPLPREKPPDYLEPSRPEDYSRLLPVGGDENEVLTIKNGEPVWLDLYKEYASDEELAQVAQAIPEFATMREIEEILYMEE